MHQIKQKCRQILPCALFFQDRERKILQLERQLDAQSGRLLALGGLNSDIPTTENTMERGRNVTWVFEVQFTSGNVYKQANFSFACRSHRQDNEESQRRIAETMWREGRGRSCLVFNKSGNNDCKLCHGSRLKDLRCRQKHEDSCKWALGLSKKSPCSIVDDFCQRLFWHYSSLWSHLLL